MLQYAEECRVLGIRFIFDPGQQCARMSGEELGEALAGAAVLILNDYELEILKQKTGLSESEILQRAEMLVVTRGEHGSSLLMARSRVDVPAVVPHRIVDPTGVGDAYRGGFMKGLAAGLDAETCGRIGSVAATYALEHLGGTSHAYTRAEFAARYQQHFGTPPAILQ
jgi:adenosine kinase